MDAAARNQADLFVMGRNGYQACGDARLGPTTAKVLNRATVPGFVVKGGTRQA